MRLEFLEAGPALIVENRDRTLVVADLHFGIEFDLAAQGWHFRSRSRERLDRVIAIAQDAKPDRIILLGDVKHGIPITSRQEFRELPAIMNRLREEAPILIAPGNHDGGIERFTGNGEMLPMTGAVIDGVGYLHGHTYPDPALAGHLLVLGHHHPFVFLRDEVGCALQAPAYLLAPVKEDCLEASRKAPAKNADPEKSGPMGSREPGRNSGKEPDRAQETATDPDPDPKPRTETRALFIPAFNEWAGLDVLRIWKNPTSPISRCMDGKSAEVFLADGTPLGLLPSLGGDERSGADA